MISGINLTRLAQAGKGWGAVKHAVATLVSRRGNTLAAREQLGITSGYLRSMVLSARKHFPRG
jgi:hypothetical protein